MFPIEIPSIGGGVRGGRASDSSGRGTAGAWVRQRAHPRSAAVLALTAAVTCAPLNAMVQQQAQPQQNQPASSSARLQSKAPGPDYVVGPKDVLAITVWNQMDLSGKYSVEADGTFTFPLVGRIAAGGRILREVEADSPRSWLKGPSSARSSASPSKSTQPADFHHRRRPTAGHLSTDGPDDAD